MVCPHIPQHLRTLIVVRARHCCEYCRVPQLNDAGTHHIDHTIALQHGGQRVAENLALACVDYNLHKGSDVATVCWPPKEIIPLFNPREHEWHDHFRLEGALLVRLPPTGEATVSLLQMNEPERVATRHVLLEEGLYPT